MPTNKLPLLGGGEAYDPIGEMKIIADWMDSESKRIREVIAEYAALEKPTPSPTYTERLIEAVRNGEVVLPPRRSVWTQLVFEVNVHYLRDDCEKFELEWKRGLLGPLPPWQPGDETSIDLATVREAAEGKS